MTADVELLPLPEYLQRAYKMMAADSHEAECKHYARANVAHATAAKDAEIEALRDGLDYIANMSGAADILELRAKAARAERLAEALRSIAASAEEATTGEGHAECASIARAALRDHDQEARNG